MYVCGTHVTYNAHEHDVSYVEVDRSNYCDDPTE